MTLFQALLRDESGAVLSAEAVLLGTLGAVGATVGLSTVSTSVDEELAEVAIAFRSLDQSFSIPAQEYGGAWKAGSSYVQPSVEESIARLKADFEQKSAQNEARSKSDRARP